MTVTTNVDGMLSLRILVLKKHGVRNSRGKKNFAGGAWNGFAHPGESGRERPGKLGLIEFLRPVSWVLRGFCSWTRRIILNQHSVVAKYCGINKDIYSESSLLIYQFASVRKYAFGEWVFPIRAFSEWDFHKNGGHHKNSHMRSRPGILFAPRFRTQNWWRHWPSRLTMQHAIDVMTLALATNYIYNKVGGAPLEFLGVYVCTMYTWNEVCTCISLLLTPLGLL
jgi:hypothetical protein